MTLPPDIPVMSHISRGLGMCTDKKLAIEVLKDIADEERVHGGEFVLLLRELAPDEKKFYLKVAEEVEEEIRKSK